MVSAATSRRSKASKKDAHVQQSVSAALPKINAKRKRDGSSGNDVGQTRAASAAGAGFSALITGRVAIEIKAALTDALDAFHAVRNVSCMRETLYLQANFFHATARPDMRDHASAAFLAVEREINTARGKRLGGDFLQTAELEALAEEWK
jgi:hypothetical protein